MEDPMVATHEVAPMLGQLNIRKAALPDNIHLADVKLLADALAPYPKDLFDLSLSEQ